MQPILPLLMLAPSIAAPSAAQGTIGSGLSYSYVELDFSVIRPDVDREELGGGLSAEYDDAQSIGVGASFSISETFFVQGGLSISSQDILLTDGIDTVQGQYDARGFTLGLGARHPLGGTVDVYAVAGIASLSADLDFPGIGSESDSESGLALTLGVRALVSTKVEFEASAARVDLGEATNTFGGAVRFHATDTFALALSAQASDDASALGLGVRFGF